MSTSIDECRVFCHSCGRNIFEAVDEDGMCVYCGARVENPGRAFGVQTYGRMGVVVTTRGLAWPQHRMTAKRAEELAGELNLSTGWENEEVAKAFFEENKPNIII